LSVKPTIILLGDQQLEANLRALGGAAATRAAGAAVRAGAAELARAQKAAAPRGKSGILVRSIGNRVIKGGRGGVMAKAGINVKGKGWQGGLNVVNVGSGGTAVGRSRRVMRGLTTKGKGRKARAQFAAGGIGRGFAPHAHLVVLGTRPRYTKGSRRQAVWSQKALRWSSKTTAGKKAYRGIMPKNPFIKRALAAASAGVRFVMRSALAIAIGKEINKFGRRTGLPFKSVG